jgi:hypothetical protein
MSKEINKNRDEPMKPKLISHTYEISSFVDFSCPICKKIISENAKFEDVCIADKNIRLNFCPNCGQALDWKNKLKGES